MRVLARTEYGAFAVDLETEEVEAAGVQVDAPEIGRASCRERVCLVV